MRRVEGRHEGSQDLVDLRLTVLSDLERRDDVHRHRGLQRGPRRPGTNSHDLVDRDRARVQSEIERRARARPNRHRLGARRVPELRDPHRVGAGLKGQAVGAVRGRDRAPGGTDDRHRGAGERRSRIRRRHRPRDRARLGVRLTQRECGDEGQASEPSDEEVNKC